MGERGNPQFKDPATNPTYRPNHPHGMVKGENRIQLWRAKLDRARRRHYTPDKIGAILDELYRLGMEGNVEAIKEWLNRGLGKVVQPIELENTNPEDLAVIAVNIREQFGLKPVHSRVVVSEQQPAALAGGPVDALPSPMDQRPVTPEDHREGAAGGVYVDRSPVDGPPPPRHED